MRTLTVILAADDTPTSIAALAALGTALPTAASTPKPASATKLANNLAWFRVYPESVNNVDVANGPARIGFNNQVSRVVATQHGTPLLPGIEEDFPTVGTAQVYNFATTYISGKTGDQFQIQYGQV